MNRPSRPGLALAALAAVPIIFAGHTVATAESPPAPVETVVQAEPIPEPAPAAGVLNLLLVAAPGWEGTVTALDATGGTKAGADGYVATTNLTAGDPTAEALCQDITLTFNQGTVAVTDPAGTLIASTGQDRTCTLVTGPGVPTELAPDTAPAPPQNPDAVPEAGFGVPSPRPPVEPVSEYANCTEVWDTVGGQITPATPGYGPHLDRDADGVACEIDPR